MGPDVTSNGRANGTDREPSRSIMDEFFAIKDRHRLKSDELRVLTGLAVHTIRVMCISRQLPDHERCRIAVERFVARNRDARGREDLRLPPSHVEDNEHG